VGGSADLLYDVYYWVVIARSSHCGGTPDPVSVHLPTMHSAARSSGGIHSHSAQPTGSPMPTSAHCDSRKPCIRSALIATTSPKLVPAPHGQQASGVRTHSPVSSALLEHSE